MSETRLIVTDIDGTLLDPGGEVRPRTRDVIRQLRSQGHVLALATSRRWAGALPVAEQLGISMPLILYDGALIQEYPDRQVLATDALPTAQAELAAGIMRAGGVEPFLQYGGAYGEVLRASRTATADGWATQYVARFADQMQLVDGHSLASEGRDPLRVVAFGPVSLLRRIAPRLSALGFTRQLLLTGSYGTGELTVFARTASKGQALLKLASSLGIPREQTLAIGDGVNDLSMFRVAGLSIAMGNAPRRVRAAAHVTTPTNAEDGLALALERYVLSHSECGRLRAGNSAAGAPETSS